METYNFELALKGTIKAYSQEDASDQLKKLLEELGGHDGYIHALQQLGVRINHHDLVGSFVIGDAGTSARAQFITREELTSILTERRVAHTVEEWRHSRWLSPIEPYQKYLHLRDALADLDHQQWQHWSKAIALVLEQALLLTKPGPEEKVRVALGLKPQEDLLIRRGNFARELGERLNRWRTLWLTPYGNLTPEQQQDDLLWADKSIELLQHHLKGGWPS